jgi:hypothetical protein
VVDLMQRVAAGAVSPDAAARAMRDMSAGYQQVMDFAGKRDRGSGIIFRDLSLPNNKKA